MIVRCLCFPSFFQSSTISSSCSIMSRFRSITQITELIRFVHGRNTILAWLYSKLISGFMFYVVYTPPRARTDRSGPARRRRLRGLAFRSDYAGEQVVANDIRYKREIIIRLHTHHPDRFFQVLFRSLADRFCEYGIVCYVHKVQRQLQEAEGVGEVGKGCLHGDKFCRQSPPC